MFLNGVKRGLSVIIQIPSCQLSVRKGEMNLTSSFAIENKFQSPEDDICLFCRTSITHLDLKKRCKTMDNIQAFVSKFCKKTPFFYDLFCCKADDKRISLCIACVNWQRRCLNGQNKRRQGGKHMLLLDHFILFMLEPGKTSLPDQRCCLRLVKALVDELDGAPSSPFLTPMPLQVQMMVSKLPRNISGETMLNDLVMAWWNFNGRCIFFMNNITAKLVRRMLKALEFRARA